MNHRKPTTIPGIYLISNETDGRFYVGKAGNITMRWHHHMHHLIKGTHINAFLQRAWNKYGAGAFVFSVVVDLSGTPKSDLKDALNSAEREVFERFRGRSYNILHVGSGGDTVPADTRRKLSEARKAAWDRFRAENPGEKLTTFGDHHEFKRSEEGRLQQSEVVLALWERDGHREYMGGLAKTRWENEEFRDNQVTRVKADWSDIDKRERRMASIQGAWSDPEAKARRLALCAATRAANKARKKA